MRYICDFHIHSKYSRATSKEMEPEALARWAKIKGIQVLGTGDFTHPAWFKELKEKLEPAENGLYKLRITPEQFKKVNRNLSLPKARLDRSTPLTAGFACGELVESIEGSDLRFILTAEISSIYSKKGKTRRIHNIIFAPSFEVVDKINTQLSWIGNLKSDGRPILGLDAKELAKIVLNISAECLIVPAHCLKPDTIIHTKGDLLKQIRDIKVGDLVLTHRNRWQRVKKIFKRNYQGKILTIKPYYFRNGLTVTPEHPFYVIKTRKNCSWNNGICKPQHLNNGRCKFKYFKNYKPEWIMANQLEIGDVLVYPRFTNAFSNRRVLDVSELIDRNSLETKLDKIRFFGTRSRYINSVISIDKDFCRLMGYYVAEGYTNGRDAIGFTFHQNEKTYIKEVIYLIKKVFGFDAEPKIRRLPSKATEIIFYSKVLYKIFSQIFYLDPLNCNALTKALPYWALGLAPDLQVEIFRGWWQGDKGYTSSRLLMNQMKIILLHLGILPSIYQDSPKAYETRGNHYYRGRKINSNSTGYALTRITFFEDKFNLLSKPEFKQFKSKSDVRHGWIDDNYVYLPIRDIEIKNYEGKVYNLEVENDNSYVTEFATVHNCWTPWFSIFGSMSGFNSIEECFEEYSKYIYSVETGLSSDPAMNWRLSALDKITLISNSDAHSPPNLGREANVFEISPENLSYNTITDLIKKRKTPLGEFLYTIEFFPEEGKYHYDGHRTCKVLFSPPETKAHNGICPKCKGRLTVGVMNRVEELADRPESFKPPNVVNFKSLVPLEEIIADALGLGKGAKAVEEEYFKLINTFDNEFNILLDVPIRDIEKASSSLIAEGVKRVREGKLKIIPGYDGEYGKIKIFNDEERERIAAHSQAAQPTLF